MCSAILCGSAVSVRKQNLIKFVIKQLKSQLMPTLTTDTIEKKVRLEIYINETQEASHKDDVDFN